MKKYPKGVLLFGSTGYLGPKLTETLISDGLNVYTVNRSTPTIKTIKDLTFPDFTQEYSSLVNLIKEEGIDTIVNLTWKGSYGDERFDRELQLSNLKNVEFLIKLSKDLNLGLINFGTVSQLITAADGTTPVSEYGNAKREVSRLLARTFTNASGNKASKLSPFWCLSLNSAVFCCNCSSDRACISASYALILLTTRRIRLSSRSFLVPTTLPIIFDNIIFDLWKYSIISAHSPRLYILLPGHYNHHSHH